MGLFTRDNTTAPAGTKGTKKARRDRVNRARNSYPVTRDAQLRLNTAVNNKHANLPDGWVSVKGAEDCES